MEEEMKLAVKNLNQIYSTANKISKEWGSKTIPLITLKKIIVHLDMDTDNKKLLLFQSQYNSVLDELYKSSETKANDMGSKHVNITFLKTMIDMSINSMTGK